MVFDVNFINNVVKIGEIITQPITDKWFYWAMLTFILHHKDWKYVNFNLAISMWVVHSFALMYPKLLNFFFSDIENKLEGVRKWRIQDIPPFICYYISEIIGDWYVFFILVRTVSRKKYALSGIFCLVTTCVKLLISFVLMYSGTDNCSNFGIENPRPNNFNCFRDSDLWRTYQKLEIINIVATAAYYGVSFIILYRTKDEYESQSKLNPSSFTIVKKFRRDSKYRMMFSCLCAVVSCCFGIPFIIDTFIHNFDFRLEVTREAIMSLTYYMIYIDQILKSEQNGGQAFRSNNNGQSSNNYSSNADNTHNKTGFSSKGVLENTKIHDNDFVATPWNSVDDKNIMSFGNSSNNFGYSHNNNYNNY